MSKTIKLNATDLQDFLSRLEKAFIEGRLSGLICMAKTRYPDGVKPTGFSGSLPKFWYGECLEALAFCDIMKAEILMYMKEMNNYGKADHTR